MGNPEINLMVGCGLIIPHIQIVILGMVYGIEFIILMGLQRFTYTPTNMTGGHSLCKGIDFSSIEQTAGPAIKSGGQSWEIITQCHHIGVSQNGRYP